MTREERLQQALEGIAARKVPETINLWPRLAAHIEERKSLMQTLRARPALALFILLLALALLTGVVYAVGKSLGYIPGIGLVDQSAPIRVLAEPVSQTREDITLTVKQAVLSADKTVVVFTLENVPWEALSHNENVGGCTGTAYLRLPDGTALDMIGGGGSPHESRFVYPPVGSEINDLVFVMPCILGTLPNKAPQNWEVPLRFIPATDIPTAEVIDIPSPTPMPAGPKEAISPEPSPLQLKKVIRTGDGYVFLLTFTDLPQSDGSTITAFMAGITITDSNGKEVFASYANDIDLSEVAWGADMAWAYRLSGGNYAWPLTFSVQTARVATVTGQAVFSFDVGTNPQPGQEWTLNRDLQLAGYPLRVTTVHFSGSGYGFMFESAPEVDSVLIEIPGTTPLGGGGGSDGHGIISASLDYAATPPTGQVTVRLTGLTTRKPGPLYSLSWQPNDLSSIPTSMYGISLVVDRYIPLDDDYYLIGHIEWTDERVKSVYPAGWNLKAYDAAGREIPLEPADWQEVGEALAPNQWVYRVYGKAFSAPVTLRATQMGVEFADPARLTLDLRPYNFTFSDDRLDGPYKTGMIPLDVPGLMATAFKAAYIKEGDMRGFEIGMVADPRLLGLTFGIESGLDTSGMYMVGGGGGSYRDEQNGLLIARILTNAPMTFPLVFAAREAQIGGEWTVTWTPPTADAGAAPFAAPSACATLETWKQAAGSPPAIPPGVVQTVLVSRGALSPEPSLFLSNLDGSNEQALVFGVGSLSPDGQKLVYGNENNRLLVLDIASGQKTALADGMSPFWSPDGSQIAFLRQTDKGLNVFVLNVYKGSPRALTDVTTNPTLAGWVGNGKKLLVVNGLEIQTIEVASGTAQTLLKTKIETYGNVSISPDGLWLAYLDKVPGRMTPGIFLARLDGSETRLLAQFDYWVASSPVFSPDGKWLAISVMNTDLPNTPMTPALVNVETCQVIPLAHVKGEIQQWIP